MKSFDVRSASLPVIALVFLVGGALVISNIKGKSLLVPEEATSKISPVQTPTVTPELTEEVTSSEPTPATQILPTLSVGNFGHEGEDINRLGGGDDD